LALAAQVQICSSVPLAEPVTSVGTFHFGPTSRLLQAQMISGLQSWRCRRLSDLWLSAGPGTLAWLKASCAPGHRTCITVT
jgi:hypothetical protein